MKDNIIAKEEKCWEIIKDMCVFDPDNLWIDVNEKLPEDEERVLTWNERFNEPRIQVFNMHYMCWDTEDGDDCEYDFDTNIIQYWMHLPKKPKQIS